MTSSSDSDGRFDAVVEDFLTRLEAGEYPEPAVYLERHPDLTEPLTRFFENLDFVDRAITKELQAAQQDGLGRWLHAADGEVEGTNDTPPPYLPAISGFRLIEEVGSGSQGVVYKAEQLGTRRVVALKVIREGTFATKAERRRFETEVELASRLNHPGIVSVYACGQDAGRDYFAMEFVDGVPLDAYMSAEERSIRDTLELFQQVCAAVSYAHQHGIMHRDLKPSNILVDSDGRVHILDLGLAKPIPGEAPVASAVTQVGDFAGTWLYASPEQTVRDPGLVDVRSDVYALGVILYEMLTDEFPYPAPGETRETIAEHIRTKPPARPSTWRREIDDDLDTIMLCTLRKEPQHRYQSAAALADDVSRYLAGDAIAAKRESSWYVLRKTLRRHKGRVAVATSGLVALIVFAVTVSVLYAQALSARATLGVRNELVRRSQRYLLKHIVELTPSAGYLNDLTAGTEDLVRDRLAKPSAVAPVERFMNVYERLPLDLARAVITQEEPRYSEALIRLDEVRTDLEDLGALSLNNELAFPLVEGGPADFIFRDSVGDSTAAESTVIGLVALGLESVRAGGQDSALRHFDAARALALALGRGPMLFHRAAAIDAREYTYDGILAVLAESTEEAADPACYVAWMHRDPPLPLLRFGLTMERMQIAQQLEHGAMAGPDGRAYMDLDRLNEIRDGTYAATGYLTNENRELAATITPHELVAQVDRYIEAFAECDGLPFPQLTQRADRIVAQLRGYRGLPVVRPLLTGYRTSFEVRGRVGAKRRATLLAALLVQHRQNEGRWPAALGDLFDDPADPRLIDPYMARPFGYVVRDGEPILYSINEDAIDNGGLAGAWGERGTDVIFARFVPQ